MCDIYLYLLVLIYQNKKKSEKYFLAKNPIPVLFSVEKFMGMGNRIRGENRKLDQFYHNCI